MAPSLKGKEKVIDGKGSSAAAKRKRNNGGDDDKTGGRKGKKRGVLQFFEDAAYEVDNDDGSDDSIFDDDFLEEEFDNEIKFDSEPSSVPYPPLVPKEEEPTEEELEKMLQERYKPGSCFVTYAEDNYESKKSTERNESWPSVKDPTIWKVKCMVGRERHSAFCLMQKYVDLKHLGNKLQIISAFALDHIKGFIYIEAEKQCDINEACNGLCSIYSSRVARVPKDDISHLFSVRSKGSGISEGMWTRVKNGKYKGDLAQVVAVNHVQKKVTVKLIPRIDLQALAEKFGRGINANRAVIPAPRLLSSSELKEFRPLMQCRRDRDTNKVYEVLDGMMLKDGYLYKKVSMDSLSFWGATPTDDELLKFEPSKDDECHDLEFLSQLYGERKKKHPLISDKGGGKGEGSSSSRAGNTFEVHDLVFFGRKDFGVIIGTEKDESFKIIKAGSEGPVVVTVQQRELKNASFDKKLFTALDQHTKDISINDTVRVLDGPLKDREGTVKKIYRGIIFLYNESIEENNGYTCFKAQMCEKVELPSEACNEKGGDPGPSVLGDFASSPESPLSPKQSDQGRNGSHNFKREDDAMFSVGQSLRIRVGPLKGYLCRVLAIRRSDITVKLDSQHKILTVKCEHLAEVRSKSSGISLGEDSDSVKPFDLLGTQDGTRDWMEGTAKAAEGGSWNAEGLSTERSSWSAFPASDFSLQQESQPSNPTVDEDADKGYSSWEAKRNPSQGTSWGAAAAARETIADSRQVAGWGNQEDTSKKGAFTAGLGSSASDSWGKAAESLDQPTDEGFKDDSWGRAAGNLNTQDDSSGSKSAWTASGVASPKATVGWGNAGGSSDQSDGSPWNKARTSKGCQAESWAAVRKDAKGSAGNQTAGVTDGGSSWNKQDVGPSWSKQGGGSSGNKPDGGSTSWSKQGGESSWSKPVGGSASWSKPDGGSASQSKPDGGSASWSKPDGGSSSWSKPEAGSSSLSKPDGGSSSWSKPGGSSSWSKPEGGSSSWSKPDGGSSPWSKPDGGSSSWSKPDGGSSPWSKPDGGSSPWSKPDGGSSSWSKPDGGSSPWSKPDGGSSSWSKQGGGSSWSKPDGRSKFWSKEDGAMEDKGDIDQHESWGRSESFNRGRGSGGRRGRDGGRGGRGQFGRGRSFGHGETSNWTKGDPDDDGLRDGTFKGHNSSWNSVQSDSYDKNMSSNRGKEKDGWSKSIASGEKDGLKWTKGWGANKETSEWGAKSHTEGNDGRAKEQEGDRGHTGKQSSEWQNKGNSNTSKASDGIWSSGWNKGSASNEQNCESKGQDDAWNKGGVSTADQASGWSNGASDSGREQSKSSAKSSDDNWSSGFNKRSIAGEEAGRPVDGGGSWGRRETPAENIKSSWNTSTTSLDGNQSSAWGGKSNWDSQKASIDNPSGLDQKSADSKMDVEADKLGAWNSKKTMDGGSSSGWGQSKWSAATDAGGGSSSGLGQSKWSGATDASGGSSSGWGQSKWSGATDAVGNQNSWSSKSNWNSDNNFGSSEEQTDNFGDKERGGNWRGGLGGRWGQGRGGSDRGGFGGRGRSDRGGFGGRGRSDRGGFGGRGRSDRGDFGGRGGSDRGGFRGRGGFGGRGRGRRDDWNRSDTGEDKPYSWNNTSNKDVNWTSSNSVGNWNHGASDKGQWQSGSSGWNVSEGSAGGGGSVQASGLIKKVGLSNDTGGSNTQASGWDRGESSLRAKDVASGDKPNSWKNGSSNTAEGWTSNNSGGNWCDGGGDKNHWQGAGSDWKNSKEPAEGGEIEQAGGWIRGPSSSKDGESVAKTGGWNSQENNWKTSNSSGGATSSRWNQPAAGEGGEGTADTRGKAVDNSWGPAKDGHGKGGW